MKREYQDGLLGRFERGGHVRGNGTVGSGDGGGFVCIPEEEAVARGKAVEKRCYGEMILRMRTRDKCLPRFSNYCYYYWRHSTRQKDREECAVDRRTSTHTALPDLRTAPDWTILYTRSR